jgi:putative membrane-bound dehydrogenase-like protein
MMRALMNAERHACLATLAAIALAPLIFTRAETAQPSPPEMTVPPGFEVELIAGPPLVNRPIVADFDERGRLYVADSSGSNAKVEVQLEERSHRIVRLEDTNGDGRFDKSVVFADRMMFPEGTMWLDGSLYVAAPPSIWKLTDTDGDGVADRREEWFQGKTLTGCANDLHGPYAGPDGWIYWTKGAFAEQTYERAGKPPLVTRASHILRRHPAGGEIEIVMTGGMDNPVDVAFTADGERIFSTTFIEHPQQGRRDALVHAVYGGVYGKVHGVIDGHTRTGDLMPVMTHLGPAVPAGLTRYQAAAFGSDYQDNFFAAMFNLRKVTRHVLEPDGATFRTRDSDFLVSTNRDFHPTDVIEDADGSLIVVDTGPWYKLCCPTSQLAKPDVLGAIYRVKRAAAPRVADPRGTTINWTASSPAQLAAMLEDERTAVRAQATAQLAKIGAAAVDPVAALLQRSARPSTRRDAVWTLTRIDAPPARAAIRTALSDRDAGVRQAAVHAVALHRDAAAVSALIAILQKDSPALQRAAAEALGRIADRTSVPALLGSTAAGPDPVLMHSLVYALIETGDVAGTQAALSASSLATRRAGLIALDQMNGGSLDPATIGTLLQSPEPLLADTAWWIAAGHPQWGSIIVPPLKTSLSAATADDRQQALLLDRLTKFSAHDGVPDLIASTATGSVGWARSVALRSMAATTTKQLPTSWTAALLKLLEGTDAEAMRQALAAVRSPAVARASGGAFQAALLTLARNAGRPLDIRLEALAAIQAAAPANAALPQGTFDAVRAGLDAAAPAAARANAAFIVERTPLQSDELAVVAAALPTAGPLYTPRLLAAFGKTKEDSAGRALIAGLSRSKTHGSIRADALRAVLANYSEAVRTEAKPILTELDSDAAKQGQRLEQMLGAMQPGDVRRGQQVFNSTRAACLSCHAIGYAGGRIGPDLTRIGEVRTDRDLLEAIVFPSASFARGYEPVTVRLKDASVVNGALRSESGEDIVVMTTDSREMRIARREIVQLQPGSVSLMPQGLDEQMTPGELADLIAFLKATRWGAQ